MRPELAARRFPESIEIARHPEIALIAPEPDPGIPPRRLLPDRERFLERAVIEYEDFDILIRLRQRASIASRR